MTQDFLIIGGGIAGLSAGARLSDLGTVTLLEAEDALGYHSSGRSAALYEAQYGQPPVVALSIASGAHYHAGGYLKPRGTMLVAGADDRDRFEEEARTFKLDHVTMTQAREIVPILNPETVAYAAWHDNAWDIDTDRQLQDFARQIRAKGGAVITGARVTAIARDDTGWTVEAGDTLDVLLSLADMDAQTRTEVALALTVEYDLRRLRPGHRLWRSRRPSPRRCVGRARKAEPRAPVRRRR